MFGNNTANDSAQLQVDATDAGFLPPRISDPVGDITTPATGLIAYDSTDNELQVYDGTNWVAFSGGGAITSLWTDNTTHISRENFHVLNSSLAAGSTTAGLDQDGTYTFYDPDKGALRGGSISSSDDAWQDVNVGNNSLAWGLRAQASGDSSIALGGRVTSFGPSSFASGFRTESGSNNSFASGALSFAYGYQSSAMGSYVHVGDTTASVFDDRNALDMGNFSFGIGLANNGTTNIPRLTGSRSMALFFDNQASSTVTGNDVFALKGGKLLIDTVDGGTDTEYGCIQYDDTANKLQFSNDCEQSSPTWMDIGQGALDADWQIDAVNNYVYNMTDNIGIGVATPDVALDVSGDIEYSGTITDVSDRRLKTDIIKLSTNQIIEKLAQINTYSFKMKDDKKGRVEFGVMAQELELLFPELVHTAKDEMGTKSVNYMGLIAPMIEASKALKDENDTLKAEMAEMKSQQTQILAALTDMKKDVAGIKLHTNYGIQKAAYENWPMMLFMMMFGAVFVLCVGGLRRKS